MGALALVVAVLVSGAPSPTLAPLPQAPPPPGAVRPPVWSALRTQDPVNVLVLVAAPPDAVLSTLDAREVRPYRRLPGLRAFAAKVTARGVEALARHPDVLGVQLDRRLRPLTAESAALVGANVVRDGWGITGAGVVVAALDTGVEVSHPDLDGGVLAQKCFVLGGCPPSNTDVGELAPDVSGHGTHITGILTGDGVRAPRGLAPGSRVVMVRVFDATSYGAESDWALAMEWVADNAARLRIRVLNMSIGTDLSYPGTCEADWPVMAAAANRVAQAGVVMFAAAGNETQANALNAPACLPGVVAVGATYDAPLGREPDTGTYQGGCFDADAGAGAVLCTSNTSPKLELLAPGARIRAAGLGGGVAEKLGTSQATAHASAAAALLLEVDPALMPADVLRLLRETGTPVVDPKAPGRSTPLLDLRAAVQATQAGFCARRAEGAECPLATGTCDGGPCTGTCAQGACRLTTPALQGSFPAATPGCSTTGAAGGLALALAALRLGRKSRGPWRILG